jgi:hypothetical protein
MHSGKPELARPLLTCLSEATNGFGLLTQTPDREIFHMFALLITAAAASSMTPTLDVTPRTMERDGVRATYTRSVDADGTIHLRGTYDDASRSPFHYKVEGRRVRGVVDGLALNFKRPRAR